MSKTGDFEHKSSGKGCDSDEDLYDGGKECKEDEQPQVGVDILAIEFLTPEKDEISAPLSVKITFDVSEEVIAGRWELKLLVDTTGRRVVKFLTEVVEDFPDGENDMILKVCVIMSCCGLSNWNHWNHGYGVSGLCM